MTYEQFDLMLDEVYGSIVIDGIEFRASQILRECDPLVYEVHYVDANDACDECYEG